MPSVRRVFLRRVVLEVNPGKCALLRSEDVKLIDQVVLTRLKQDAIELELPQLLDGNVANAVGKRECPTAPAVARPARGDGKVEFDLCLREVEQVVPVDMPGQNA